MLQAAALTQCVADQGLACVRVMRMDATKCDKALDEQFDHVLLDAPCSGLGTILALAVRLSSF